MCGWGCSCTGLMILGLIQKEVTFSIARVGEFVHFEDLLLLWHKLVSWQGCDFFSLLKDWMNPGKNLIWTKLFTVLRPCSQMLSERRRRRRNGVKSFTKTNWLLTSTNCFYIWKTDNWKWKPKLQSLSINMNSANSGKLARTSVFSSLSNGRELGVSYSLTHSHPPTTVRESITMTCIFLPLESFQILQR